MMSHTKGPWKLRRPGCISNSEGDLVATTGYRVTVRFDEDDANARLIAAAPELLAALEAVRNTDDHAAPEVRALVRAALAKAGA